MYTKDKVCRITLRLNQEQFDYVKSHSDFLGVSPSDFLRMVVNSSMALESKMKIKTPFSNVIEGGGSGRENDKADLNDLV